MGSVVSMNRFIKTFSFGTLILLICFFGKLEIVNAQVVINEFSSYETSGDWIEFYAFEDTDISGWLVRDSAKTIVKIIDEGILIGPTLKKYYAIDVGGRLNRGADAIRLFKADDVTLVDEIFYGNDGGVCAPGPNQSVGRYPDANSTLERFSVPTKDSSNDLTTLDPCVEPAMSDGQQTISQSTSFVESAFININEVKSENGNSLSSVRIYLNGEYIHHYAPETLKFCDDCNCGTSEYFVACKLGVNTIDMEKDGYQRWGKSVEVLASQTIDLNPVLVTIVEEAEEEVQKAYEENTSSLNDMVKSVKSITIPESIATDESKIGSISAFVLGINRVGLDNNLYEQKRDVIKENSKNFAFPLVLTLSGLGFVGGSVIMLFKDRLSVNEIRSYIASFGPGK